MPISVCPDCSEKVFVDSDCEQGDIVVCEECGSDLVVVGLDPIELDMVSASDDGHERDGFGIFDPDDDEY